MSDSYGKESFGFYPVHPGHGWQPAWLNANENETVLPVVSTVVSPAPPIQIPPPVPPSKTRWDLDADQTERFEERCCIMHYDGGLPWDEAERLALEEVLAYDADAYLAAIRAASTGPAPVVTEARP